MSPILLRRQMQRATVLEGWAHTVCPGAGSEHGGDIPAPRLPSIQAFAQMASIQGSSHSLGLCSERPCLQWPGHIRAEDSFTLRHDGGTAFAWLFSSHARPLSSLQRSRNVSASHRHLGRVSGIFYKSSSPTTGAPVNLTVDRFKSPCVSHCLSGGWHPTGLYQAHGSCPIYKTSELSWDPFAFLLPENPATFCQISISKHTYSYTERWPVLCFS